MNIKTRKIFLIWTLLIVVFIFGTSSILIGSPNAGGPPDGPNVTDPNALNGPPDGINITVIPEHRNNQPTSYPPGTDLTIDPVTGLPYPTSSNTPVPIPRDLRETMLPDE